MLEKIRLLPLVILAALALLGVKVEQIVTGVAAFGGTPALAESKAATAPTTNDHEPAAASDMADAGRTVAKADEAAETAAAGDEAPARKPGSFSAAEVEVLENLTKRREELDERARALEVQEQVLVAAERRIEEKIAKLKELEARFQGMLKQHDEETERKLKSLVKVYENMKPKDAARIFEQLDMEILLDVTERMRENKMAPVLAAMDPEKAKALTVELATRRALPETGLADKSE